MVEKFIILYYKHLFIQAFYLEKVVLIGIASELVEEQSRVSASKRDSDLSKDLCIFQNNDKIPEIHGLIR